MLNLYLAVRHTIPVSAEAEARIVAFLQQAEFIGAPNPEGDYPPGAEVGWLFNEDAHEALLPAELTFGSLSIGRSARPRFLPDTPEGFEDARCSVCDDPLDRVPLAEALGRLSVFPVDRFTLLCPSCRTELTIKQVDFGQPTAISMFWVFIEGVGTGRISTRIIERLSRHAGVPLILVPEVVEDQAEAWIPPPGLRRGRRR